MKQCSWRQCFADHVRSFSLSCTIQWNSLWIQSKHITSCDRWTKSEIFLSNNFLAIVKVTDLTYLTCHCFDRNGLVQTAATTGIRKKVGSKANTLLGRVSSRLVAVTAWTKAQWSKRSVDYEVDFSLLLLQHSHPCVSGGKVRVKQEPGKDYFCLNLVFCSSAFGMGLNVFGFGWGFRGMFQIVSSLQLRKGLKQY